MMKTIYLNLMCLLALFCQATPGEDALFAPASVAPVETPTAQLLQLPSVDPDEGWSQLTSRGAIMMLSAPSNDQAVAGAEILRRAGEYYSIRIKNGTKNLRLPDLSPAGKNLLVNNGVDPKEFQKRLLRGTFSNTEEVLAAAGTPRDLEDEEVDKGVALAEAELRGTLGDAIEPPKEIAKSAEQKIVTGQNIPPINLLGDILQNVLLNSRPIEKPAEKIVVEPREDIVTGRGTSNVFRLAARHYRAWRNFGAGQEE